MDFGLWVLFLAPALENKEQHLFEVFAHHSVSHGEIGQQLEANNKDNKPEQQHSAGPHKKERKAGQIVNATVNNNRHPSSHMFPPALHPFIQSSSSSFIIMLSEEIFQTEIFWLHAEYFIISCFYCWSQRCCCSSCFGGGHSVTQQSEHFVILFLRQNQWCDIKRRYLFQ